jgi:hypothetical protein
MRLDWQHVSPVASSHERRAEAITVYRAAHLYQSRRAKEFNRLRPSNAVGGQYADAWIETSFDRLGVESTVDICAQYL